MRIITGKLGGRQFNPPHGSHTHPMSDKMRGALFNVLGDIEGLSVLDAYSGSGALSFEAVSRGAAHALAVESDKLAQRSIAKAINQLELAQQVKLICANVSSWSDNNTDHQFDLVFCDPPYDNLQIAFLQKLVRHLKPGGIYVLSWPGRLEPPELIGASIIARKNYGDSRIVFYKKGL